MRNKLKIIRSHVYSFVLHHWLVIFFVTTIGYKLYYANKNILKLDWAIDDFHLGVAMGYLCTAMIFLPLLFVKKHKNKATTIIAFILSLLIVVDVVYYSYFSTLPTVGLLNAVGQTESIGPAILGLLYPGLLLYFADIILIVIFRKPITRFIENIKIKHDLSNRRMFKANLGIVFTVLIAFWMTLSFSSFERLNNIVNRSYDTKETARLYSIFMAHYIDVARYIDNELRTLSDTEKAELEKWVKQYKPEQTTDDLTAIAKGKNVIMIQVESLGGFVINQTINGKEITPNLNKLTRETNFFPNNRFMIGAGHTSDADFVANTSYFPLDDSAVFVRYSNDDFTSLPKTMIKDGYSAFAYHGFNRNFWNRNAAYSALGYQKFYAADNFTKGQKINMGLNDGDFLSETADYIKKQPKPSFSYVVTLTSHVPFGIKKGINDNLGLNVKDYPSQVGGYLENINYTDRMLGKFFDKLKTSGLYDDSLIVIYGDHVPVLNSFEAGTINYDPNSNLGKETPLFVKLPDQTEDKTLEAQSASINIMPTILDLTGIKTNALMFGQSLFANKTDALNICTNQLPVFKLSGDCEAAIETEKRISNKIIRYNQFDNLSKLK